MADEYGFQARQDALCEAQQSPPATPEAYPVDSTPPAPGSAPLVEQLVNPRQTDDANHVRACSLCVWHNNRITDYIERVKRNPTTANMNLLVDVLVDYRDSFISGQLFAPDAKHEQ